ncbi:thioredoxin domain-containing protein 8-like isoform 1-T1 [Macrochelys suwanniensis]
MPCKRRVLQLAPSSPPASTLPVLGSVSASCSSATCRSDRGPRLAGRRIWSEAPGKPESPRQLSQTPSSAGKPAVTDKAHRRLPSRPTSELCSLCSKEAAGSKLVVVDFSAKWCGPCKAISPVIHDLAVRYDNVMFCSVDIDRAEDVANSCKIVAMPTFQMFKKMEKIFEITGTDIRKLETKIEELM